MADDPRDRMLIEGQKTFIIINAVGAMALLAFLSAIWPYGGSTALKKAVLNGIVAFSLGVLLAALGYMMRDWAARMNPSKWLGRIFGQVRMWLPVIVAVCFLAGVILPVIGGHDSLSNSSGQASLRRR
jgi:uncharacterized membrane protein YedE/YeeE